MARTEEQKLARRSYCRICGLHKSRPYKTTCSDICAKELEQQRVQKKRRNLYAKTFGIPVELVDSFKALPCEICGKPSECTDHNHLTYEVRGRLCTACNTGLGQFTDSPEILRKAADYLETSGTGWFHKDREGSLN